VLSEDQLAEMRRMVGPRRLDAAKYDAGPGLGGGFQGGPRPTCCLSSDQQRDIEKLWSSQGARTDEAVRDIVRNLKAIRVVYRDYRFDERAARKLIADINKSQLKLMKTGLTAQIGIRRVLSAGQFQDLTRTSGNGTGDGYRGHSPRGRGR